jgi:hypothetical protein
MYFLVGQSARLVEHAERALDEVPHGVGVVRRVIGYTNVRHRFENSAAEVGTVNHLYTACLVLHSVMFVGLFSSNPAPVSQ